jgi:hypothetical protein
MCNGAKYRSQGSKGEALCTSAADFNMQIVVQPSDMLGSDRENSTGRTYFDSPLCQSTVSHNSSLCFQGHNDEGVGF